MAEENEKKPGFVVHKKQQDSAPAAATATEAPAAPAERRPYFDPQSVLQGYRRV